jgi:hypothetical protein
MSTFETTATVEKHGRVLLAGVPFAPGTEVEVMVSAKLPPKRQVTSQDDAALIAARERMRELFNTIKGFRNSPRIPREELHERGSVH